MPCESTQYWKAAEILYVQTFLVTDSGGPGGKVTDDLLRHVWNAHASGAAHQEFPAGAVQYKYTDEVAEKRYVDSGKVHEGDLQPNRG